jgi:hypothetical protein
MPQYRVRPGFHHGVGKKYGPSDILTLTEQDAIGFLDKLERVEETAPVPADKRAGESDSAVASEPTLQFWQEPAGSLTGTMVVTIAASPTTTGTLTNATVPVTLTTVPANAVDFAAIKGISERMQDVLYAEGWYTWESVLQAGVIGLRDVGIDMIHARMLFNIAQREAD